MAMLRAKMFNLRPFLNSKTVEKFSPMLETVIADMTNDELAEAHKALAIVSGMLTHEKVSRDEAPSLEWANADTFETVIHVDAE